MRRLEYPAGSAPRAWGRLHGERFAGEVRELAALRLELVARLPQFPSAERVLALAERHLPLLEREAPELHAELMGIAEGAGATAAELVVLNHYTDLKDLPGDGAAQAGPEEGCSAVFARTPGGPLLGQTWDMHGTACPFVTMMRVPARDGAAEAWLLTLTGCLGLAGLSALGVGIAINNLRSRDARIGLVWPALVRRALAAPDARRARDLILASPLGAGHHYLVADERTAFGIETSGSRRSVVFDGAQGGCYVHTNHCLSPEVGAVSAIGPESTTRERYERLTRDVAARPVTGARDLWERLGSHDGFPRSVCTHLAGPATPHAMATCAALVMEPAAGRLWAAPGCIHAREPERFELARERVTR